MRLVLKALMLTVVIFGGVNYAAYLQTGKSFLPMWLEKTIARIARLREGAGQALSSMTTPGAGDSGTDIFYKWTDANGVLQFTNVPPPEGIEAEIIQVDPNANLLPAVTASQTESEPASVATTPPVAEKPGAAPDVPFPYTPTQIQKTMEDARKAQQMMNEKLEKQQEILDNL